MVLRPPKKSTKTLWIVLLGMMLAGLLVWLWPSPEPAYKGKKLKAWVELMYSNQNPQAQSETAEALRAIGTNALPYLVRLMRAKDSLLRTRLIDLLESQDVIHLQVTRGNRKNGMGRQAFKALGAIATPAVPRLVPLLSDPVLGAEASEAIKLVGTNSVPGLLQGMSNSDGQVRAHVALLLAYFHEYAAPAVPALIKDLGDTNAWVRSCAAYALGEIRQEPLRVIPALMPGLRDKAPQVRIWTATALSQFEGQATSAVPLLLKALQDSDSHVALQAQRALKMIDPEAATRAGVK